MALVAFQRMWRDSGSGPEADVVLGPEVVAGLGAGSGVGVAAAAAAAVAVAVAVEGFQHKKTHESVRRALVIIVSEVTIRCCRR